MIDIRGKKNLNYSFGHIAQPEGQQFFLVSDIKMYKAYYRLNKKMNRLKTVVRGDCKYLTKAAQLWNESLIAIFLASINYIYTNRSKNINTTRDD